MLRTLADRGDRRPLKLYYCNKRWDEVIFREELDALARRLDLKVNHVLSEPPADWNGTSGRLDAALLERTLPANRGALVYFVCGPKGLNETVTRALRSMGVPLARIHFELFDMV